MSELPKHTVSSGNVFADMGLPNPEELLAKADLAIQISRIIEERGLTQAQAAELLAIDQPKISALVRGRLEGFSIERLTRFRGIRPQFGIGAAPCVSDESVALDRLLTLAQLLGDSSTFQHGDNVPYPVP